MDDELALSLAETEGRFKERQEYLERALGYHATAKGKALYDQCVPALAAFIRDELEKPGKTHPRGLRPVLKRLKDPERIAVSALTALMRSPAICRDEDCEFPRQETFEKLGNAIHGECRARRTRVFTSSRTKSPFASSVWDHEEICHAGQWLLDCVVQALPEVFRYDKDNIPEILPKVTDRAVDIAYKAMLRDPVLVACKRQPEPWTGFREGGYRTDKSILSASFVRGCDEKTKRAIRAAMADASLRPHVDAVNNQQAVPWTIDDRMLEIVKRYGPYNLAQKPGAPKYRWTTKGKRRYKLYDEPDELFLWLADMAAADRLHGEPFWVPMNLDWRGRIYGIPFFNYQRQDWVRSLFRFERGQPIGYDGLYWLKIHVATTGDFESISKRPFAERIQWVDDNIQDIYDAAARPLDPDTYEWWSRAGKKKKYQFISACMELSEALQSGPTFISRLPVSFDATASGLQHLCAMSRADEGALVNLAPSEVPKDVYALIADAVTERVRRNLFAAGELLMLGVEVTRSLVKSCVMTYFYNSTEWSQTEQLTKSLNEMGFHKYAEKSRSLAAAGFHKAATKELSYRLRRGLIKLTRKKIEESLPKPKEIMEFVGNLALVLATANESLSWTSLSGMPVCNRYQVPSTRRIEFQVNGKIRQYTIANGFKSELNAAAMVRSAAPNFVHSCDAAHMALVTNAAVAEGIVDLAMVHDSFGCPAAQAGRFREIIREQFVKMYEEHDVLAELRASAALALGTDDCLPPVPDRGNLDLRGVLLSDFAFD